MSTSVVVKPFYTEGQTIAITGATTAPTGVQAIGNSSESYLISNSGAVVAFLGVGQSAAAAATNAAAVTSAGTAIPLLPGMSRVFNFPDSSYFSVSTSSSTAVVYVTPGSGGA